MFEKANCNENDAVVAQAQTAAVGTEEKSLDVSLQSSTVGVKTVFLAEGLKNLRMGDLDELARELLSDAKGRFKEARRKATEAFGNEALNTSDRILAMVVRVMGTILEKVDNPANALQACRVCLEELHALPAVQKSFSVELTGGLKSWFNKDERNEIINAVCHINHVIYGVTQLVGSSNKGFFWWPVVDAGTERFEPLRDLRVSEILDAQGIDHTFQVWSFGVAGELYQSVTALSTNSIEQFFVGVDGFRELRDRHNVKVFDRNGKFLRPLFCADEKGKRYVRGMRNGWGEFRCVYLFDKDNNRRRLFYLRHNFRGWALTVEESSKRIFVLGDNWRDSKTVVDMQKSNGTFVCSFVVQGWRDGVLDITAGNDGRVFVLTTDCVQDFDVHGVLLHKWSHVREETLDLFSQKFHWAGEHIFIVKLIGGIKNRDPVFCVSIHTTGGELVSSIQLELPKKGISTISGITVTRDGRIAIAYNPECSNHRAEILVL